MKQPHPFSAGIPGANTQYVDAESRIRAVQNFSLEQCDQAIRLPGLQKTVAQAIHRRIRKLRSAGR